MLNYPLYYPSPLVNAKHNIIVYSIIYEIYVKKKEKKMTESCTCMYCIHAFDRIGINENIFSM